MFSLGLHGDGVPVQGRMNQSTLEFWTVNLVGSRRFNQLRIPICALGARMIGWQTIEKLAKSCCGIFIAWLKANSPGPGMSLEKQLLPKSALIGIGIANISMPRSGTNRKACAGFARPSRKIGGR